MSSFVQSGSLKSQSGGISQWDYTTNPTLIQSGKNTIPGVFIVTNAFTGTIDDVVNPSAGSLIYFDKTDSRWKVSAGNEKMKGTFATLSALEAAVTSPQEGDFALINATGTFWAYSLGAWADTGSAVAPDSLTATDIVNNLTSTSIDKVLSAKQGKELKDLIDVINGKIPATNYSFINATSVTIDHGKGYFPLVNVIDNSNNDITSGVSIDHVNTDRFVVSCDLSISGKIIYY